MVHTVLKVAKALPPSVVLIGEADTVWTSGKKKGGGEPPNRILKNLMTLLAPKKGPALLEPSDRVLILGTSSEPYNCEKAKVPIGHRHTATRPRGHAATRTPQRRRRERKHPSRTPERDVLAAALNEPATNQATHPATNQARASQSDHMTPQQAPPRTERQTAQQAYPATTDSPLPAANTPSHTRRFPQCRTTLPSASSSTRWCTFRCPTTQLAPTSGLTCSRLVACRRPAQTRSDQSADAARLLRHVIDPPRDGLVTCWPERGWWGGTQGRPASPEGALGPDRETRARPHLLGAWHGARGGQLFTAPRGASRAARPRRCHPRGCRGR